TWIYEDAGRAGRLLGTVEQIAGEAPRQLERLIYAGVGTDEQACNMAGQVSQHYDTAGLMQTHAISLSGVAQRVTRRLLGEVDDPQA
ncbi:RHS repeat protein, partial [Klebsiella pneumoniae]|nr:RHS repeat protein [Klebsiella pneumoniae]